MNKNHKIFIGIFLMVLGSIGLANAQCGIVSKGTGITSLTKLSWGQSFVTGCSKDINYIVFNSATAVNSSFTLTIFEGADCSGTVLYTQTIPQIIDGDNRVDLNTPVGVIGNKTYFFSVQTDGTSTFKIRFNSVSQVSGNLKTHNTTSPKTACDYNFPTYDWAFSIDSIPVTVAPPPFPTLAKNIDLFILAGQSNAVGQKGDATFYPTDTLNLDPYIGLNYVNFGTSSSNGNWMCMQAQTGLFTAGHFGPEVSFSRKLKAAGYNPAIFKFSHGSTSICTSWLTPGAHGKYDLLVDSLKKAITNLELKGYTPTIRGFIWIQGENDSKDSTCTANYYASLLSIVKDVRNNVAKNPNLPVLLGVDEQYPGVYISKIIDSQKRIANEEANVKFTSMIGLQKADATHLTPSGLYVHGCRLADAYKSMNLSTEIQALKNVDFNFSVVDNQLYVSSKISCLELSVFDTIGRFITKKTSTNGNVQLPICKGFCIVKIKIKDEIITQKIIN
jgi:hypothetical protein